MRYLYKGLTYLPRYDLKFNANCGRVLYTTRKYIAVVAWIEEGYSILDFGDETDKEVWNRLFRNHKSDEMDVDCLLMLNCWDVLYLLENKDCHREDFFGMAAIVDFNEEEEEKTD
jgi:hypothetical protein